MTLPVILHTKSFAAGVDIRKSTISDGRVNNPPLHSVCSSGGKSGASRRMRRNVYEILGLLQSQGTGGDIADLGGAVVLDGGKYMSYFQ